MKISAESCLLMVSLVLFHLGNGIQAVSYEYDYSVTTKCLEEPNITYYGGGVIVNPEFNYGIEGWTVYGNVSIALGTTERENNFVLAYGRERPLDGLSQCVQLEAGIIYSFSAWIRIGEGSEPVSVVFQTEDGKTIRGGRAIAKQGCWSLLKGGIAAKVSGSVTILFEIKNTTVNVWVDNVSLQPFTMEEWRSHQDASIDKVKTRIHSVQPRISVVSNLINSDDKVRKSKIKFQLLGAGGVPLGGALVSVEQTKSAFPLGCGMNKHILTSPGYQVWFNSRFRFATFTNEMKWYSTEIKLNQENYTYADNMLALAESLGIKVRGHNILWDNPKQQPQWVHPLPSDALGEAAYKRLNSVVSRYSGKVIGWDVMNENLHFRFFEDKLGNNASSDFYSTAYRLDPNTTMFMNEYNTIEYVDDEKASPVNYVNKIEEIRSNPWSKGMLAGIGVQGHFGGNDGPNLVHIRSSLDILGSTGLPVWITELSIDNGTNKALHFKEILREVYSHPAVEGIILFAGPEVAGFQSTVLADMNFKNTPLGDVVDEFIAELKTGTTALTTDSQGFAEFSLFKGDYDVTVETKDFTDTSSFTVSGDELIPFSIS